VSDVTNSNDRTDAPALEQIGDRWTLLIIWASLNGITRFDDYQRHLGVARNILSTRLRRLLDLGVLVKRPVHDGARRLEYRVTPKGQDLRSALEQIEIWGEKWDVAQRR